VAPQPVVPFVYPPSAPGIARRQLLFLLIQITVLLPSCSRPIPCAPLIETRIPAWQQFAARLKISGCGSENLVVSSLSRDFGGTYPRNSRSRYGIIETNANN
jgi:hypothetical protein